MVFWSLCSKQGILGCGNLGMVFWSNLNSETCYLVSLFGHLLVEGHVRMRNILQLLREQFILFIQRVSVILIADYTSHSHKQIVAIYGYKLTIHLTGTQTSDLRPFLSCPFWLVMVERDVKKGTKRDKKGQKS